MENNNEYINFLACEMKFSVGNGRLKPGDIAIEADDGEYTGYISIEEAISLRDSLNTQILKATDMQRRKDKE